MDGVFGRKKQKEKRKEREGNRFLFLVWMVKNVREGENQEAFMELFLFLTKVVRRESGIFIKMR